MLKLWWELLKAAFGPKDKPSQNWECAQCKYGLSHEGDDDYPPELYTIEEFRVLVKLGYFNDYDGSGYYANPPETSRIYVDLSKLARGEEEKGYTHIEWFNK